MKTDGNGFVFSDNLYNVLKRVVQIILPAISSAYFALASIWDLPAADKVVGTIAVLTTFLGICLGISSKTYESSGAAYDGNIVVIPKEDGGKTVSLELNGDPELLAGKDTLAFKKGFERPLKADPVE